MPYDLQAMKLLARGGQADIYEIDEGSILRVLRGADPKDTRMLMSEHTVMNELRTRGVGVPEVYEFTEVVGKPALVMERIAGPSMMDLMLRNPFIMRRTARELARLHFGFLGCSAPEGLMAIRKRADILIDRSAFLDEADRDFVRLLLAGLPDGESLLHGDFHPGNILTRGSRRYIIDWFGATTGDPVSDIAHTYLLCADKPRIPTESILKHVFLRAMARQFGRAYLKEIRPMLGFDMGNFGKWMAVRAAERTVYGQPSELKSKARFVRACRMLQDQGVSPQRWYKKL
jgi:aminoglycoside phosphotransferase (APT) family kinase protein